jgi:hypothetical protein
VAGIGSEKTEFWWGNFSANEGSFSSSWKEHIKTDTSSLTEPTITHKLKSSLKIKV